MTIDAIKEVRDAAPFKSFTIRTADGTAFEVPNHDSLLVAEGGKTLIVVTPDQKFWAGEADEFIRNQAPVYEALHGRSVAMD